MRERREQVLEAALREFIRSGKPASSLELSRRSIKGAGSATIRAELARLTDEGYLSQLHTSGGRVPTDKGYEWFAERILFEPLAENAWAGAGDLAAVFFEGARREFVREAAHRLRLFGAGYAHASGNLYQSGLTDLFERLELENRRELAEIARDIELLEERCAKLAQRSAQMFRELPRVFIGRKSPVTTSEHLSVVLDGYGDGAGGHFLFLAIGPKRMDYQRTLSLMRTLHDSIFTTDDL